MNKKMSEIVRPGITLLLVLVIAGCISESIPQDVFPACPDADGYTPPASAAGYTRDYETITEEYFDTEARASAEGFCLEEGGSFYGSEEDAWIQGISDGSKKYTPYYRTVKDQVPLRSEGEYELSFTYRIYDDDEGFETIFFSSEAAGHDDWLPGITLTGSRKKEGRAVLRQRLKDYGDYEIRWNIVGSGRIIIKDIQLRDVQTRRVVAVDSGGETSAGPGSAFSIQGGCAILSTEQGLNRLRMTEGSSILTDPDVISFTPGRAVFLEFDYRVMNRPLNDTLGRVVLYLEGAEHRRLEGTPLDNGCSEAGRFSGGVLIPDDHERYVLSFQVYDDADLVLENLRILEQVPVRRDGAESPGATLQDAPFPRFGNYQMGLPEWIASDGCETGSGEEPWMSMQELDTRLSLYSVLAGLEQSTGNRDPAFGFRLRSKNPGILLLPYVIAHEQFRDDSPPADPLFSTTAETYRDGIDDGWWLRNSRGDIIADPDWTDIRKMNISRFCPEDGEGRSFIDYFIEKTVDLNLRPGTWDGLFIDNLFAGTNPHIEHAFDPERFDADYNLNRVRDETIEDVHDITLDASLRQLMGLRNRVGDAAVILGNAGPWPELALAPLVNGYVFEMFNIPWYRDHDPSDFNELSWSKTYSMYRHMEKHCREPVILILEAGGLHGEMVRAEKSYREPGPVDTRNQRLALGTALLGNGFYEYDLFDARSAPVFFDEWCVNAEGVSTMSTDDRGWLGKPEGQAREIYSEAEVLVDRQEDIVLTDKKFGEVVFECGKNETGNPLQYVIEFSWSIRRTLRYPSGISIETGARKEWTDMDEVTAGSAGVQRLHITVEPDDECLLMFHHPEIGEVILSGLKITRTEGILFRRDFENGTVFVNPTLEDYVLDAAAEGLRRISGVLDPGVNNGEPLEKPCVIPAADALVTIRQDRY